MRIPSVLSSLRAFESLRYREYRLILYGHICSSMGQWMDEVTRGWLMYQLTNSTVQLGLVIGIQAIPFLLLSPLAGSAADRYSRKTVVVWAQSLNALLYAVTALLICTGWIRPWHLYVTAFFMASVQAFILPARAAIISDTVPLNCLTNAIGLSSIVWNLARSTGPALSGVLIAAFGTGETYFVQAALFLLATYWTVKLGPELTSSANTDTGAVHRESFAQSIIEGWKFSWRNETVRVGILTVMIVSFFMIPFRTILPVFARDILSIGATGQGLLLTAMGIGALCSAMLIASAGDRLPRGKLMLGAVTLYGVLLVIFAYSSWFPLSLVVMGFAGLCNVLSYGMVQTVVQYYSPAEFRGRTAAIFSMSQVVGTMGSILIGTLSALWGARLAMASLAIMGSVTMITLFIVIPRARHIR
jgi:MFS family permease